MSLFILSPFLASVSVVLCSVKHQNENTVSRVNQGAFNYSYESYVIRLRSRVPEFTTGIFTQRHGNNEKE